MGRLGSRPLRRGLLSSITTVNLVQFDCHCGHGTPCPYDCNTNVSYTAVGDGIPDVPKRNLYINLKFGLQFFPNKPTYPLDLRAEALGKS